MSRGAIGGSCILFVLFVFLTVLIFLCKSIPISIILIPIAIILLLGSTISGARTCGLCGNPIRKTSYREEVNGKLLTLCPNCNRRCESRRSKEAVSALFTSEKASRFSECQDLRCPDCNARLPIVESGDRLRCPQCGVSLDAVGDE